MVKHVTAVVENGVLRPLEPLEIPEGREVELVVRLVPAQEEIRRRIEAVKAMQDTWPETDGELAEDWEAFHQELQENRAVAPDRA